MKFSEKLNGFWEEGYHYYIKIRDGEMTVRDYRRKVELRTHIAYDADLLEAGERTVISVEDPVLSRTASGDLFTMIRELAYEKGELRFLYYYTITGEELYTLKKVDHGPFDHIVIRDDEYLASLQGEWIVYHSEGKRGSVLTIDGSRLTWLGAKDCPIHVVSEKDFPDSVSIVPADLTEDSFPGFNRIQVLPDRLTTYIQVYDMNVPMTIFARADMMDRIEVHEENPTPYGMMRPSSMPTGMMGDLTAPGWMGGMPGGGSAQTAVTEQKKSAPKFCPNCGYALKGVSGKFCPNCGNRL